MSKSVILTGLRANNDLHLGNYLGALLPIVQMQQKYAGKYQINLFVPDLHSFTTPIDHNKLYVQTMHNLKLFVASGLKLNDLDTFLYRQSRIPAHSELTVILNSFTYIGELRRMTQFKEKTQSHQSKLHKDIQAMTHIEGVSDAEPATDTLHVTASGTILPIGETVSAGLFDYPVLMAADILLYGAKYVPVGADQTQHVELARDIAIRMNNKFGDGLLSPPEAEKEQIAFAEAQHRLRIKDLLDPTKKMSKSDESGKGVIFLGDNPDAAAKKVLGAATDSLGKITYDHDKQPGISNLMDIYVALSGKSLESTRQKYEGQTQYGPFKQDVANVVKSFLEGFQAKLADVDEKALEAKLEASEAAMNEVANQTLHRVQVAVGLRK